MAERSSLRHRDRGSRLADFDGEILVRCARCDGCARTFRRDPNAAAWHGPRRLVCACGYLADWDGPTGALRPGGGPHDDYFHRPLWLQTPCAGHTVWAYNAQHLAELEAFIGARLREQVRDPVTGWKNRSMVGRLPRWMKAARHRDDVLRGLARLRALLPGR